ncbi:hypothetical protein AVEN_141804-1 [Araneus ventricosus]|uniref:Uncharacterized protein n=1 Tax=Araneus ventricosus TaxID=182803 RepID=A0A4Y2E8V9_ARAVE|nr:hypothetical protein AVEN_141804-1 [Araneus ventricosus]
MWAHLQKNGFGYFRTSSCNDKGHRYAGIDGLFCSNGRGNPHPDQEASMWLKNLFDMDFAEQPAIILKRRPSLDHSPERRRGHGEITAELGRTLYYRQETEDDVIYRVQRSPNAKQK